MKSLYAILTLFLLAVCCTNAQTVIMNPDGTVSTVVNNGTTSTIFHPNGTHSTVVNNGATSTIFHPDGTHSTETKSDLTRPSINQIKTDSIQNSIADTSKTVSPFWRKNKKNKGKK